MENGVKTRLILAGINELEEHGVHDFSLRRVALAAQVSCAAPYRHFKDKNRLIEGIIEYIGSRWELLSREIKKAVDHDKSRLVVETCMANIRFWLANSNYRSVLMMSPQKTDTATGIAALDKTVLDAVCEYCTYKNISDKDKKIFMARTVIYGTVMLVGTGVTENSEKTLYMVREQLEREFS